MYQLYEQGAFGNKLLSWPTLDDYLEDDYFGLIVLRYKGIAGGAWIRYDIPPSEVCSVVEHWISEGADRNLITVNQSAPNPLLRIQGEVMRSVDYLDLRYTLVKQPMRAGLDIEQLHANGLEAVGLLRHHLDPSSYEELWELLDTYEDAVVEFSTWDTHIGSVPFRNTVFWEVRNY